MSLKGQLLVAAPGLRDPNFHRTVVLIGEHGADGAMGVVLNRPSDVTVADAVEALVPLVGADTLVYVGGPVEESAVVVMAEFEDASDSSGIVFENVGFVPGEPEAGAEHARVRAARVYAGYSGWGPGQLDEELAENAWIVAPALVEDVFGDDPDGLWSRVLRRLGGRFRMIAAMPPDPRLN